MEDASVIDFLSHLHLTLLSSVLDRTTIQSIKTHPWEKLGVRGRFSIAHNGVSNRCHELETVTKFMSSRISNCVHCFSPNI